MSQEMGNARLASVLERFAGPAKGFAELAIRRRESELGRPFPPAVRYLYQHCTPHRWAATIKESIRLLPLEEIQWLAEESAFIFAAGMYGDAIFQQCGGSSGDDGAIVLADALMESSSFWERIWPRGSSDFLPSTAWSMRTCRANCPTFRSSDSEHSSMNISV